MNESVKSTCKILFTSLLVMVSLVALAEEGKGDKKGDKKKNGENTQAVARDTADYILPDVNVANQVDDTLVIEDWDLPGDGGDEGDGETKSANTGESGVSGTGDYSGVTKNSLLDDMRTAIQKEYKVEFSIYPNPVASVLNVKPDVEPTSFIIKDIQGKIYQKDSYVPQINIAELSSGTYFIQLVYEDLHIESRKFIKY